jgi:hypothetical protein
MQVQSHNKTCGVCMGIRKGKRENKRMHKKMHADNKFIQDDDISNSMNIMNIQDYGFRYV